MLVFIHLFIGGFCGVKETLGQSHEVQQLLLNVEKLRQFRDILDQMQRGYETISKGYNTVRDLSSGNFNLHKHFLDGLWQVSPSVQNYRKVGEIIDYQLKLARLSRQASIRYATSGLLNGAERNYLLKIYDRVLRESLRQFDELTMVLTAGSMRMSDEQRLAAIDAIYLKMRERVHFVREFDGSTAILIANRKKELSEVDRVKKLYDLPQGGGQ
ncbi:TerB family tellurite resistance protein [Sphingobacterium corticis]|uniref:TerB family tellurite resistance protein n=1 Tax=Sphingobacterium corticis TaxID=1812823 RepID=A0ABW5NJF7_9SPHI